MGKMSWISHLCETNKRDELIEEVGGLAKQLGKTAIQVADGFLEAHSEMRLQKNNPAFTKLNEIADEMQEVAKEQICVICGEKIQPDPISGWDKGCNAEPVAKGQCCSICDNEIVIPARIEEYANRDKTPVIGGNK